MSFQGKINGISQRTRNLMYLTPTLCQGSHLHQPEALGINLLRPA